MWGVEAHCPASRLLTWQEPNGLRQVPASVAGSAVGIILLGLLDSAGYEQAGTLAAMASIGISLGLAQQRLLLTCGASHSRWVALSTAGWVLGGACGD